MTDKTERSHQTQRDREKQEEQARRRYCSLEPEEEEDGERDGDAIRYGETERSRRDRHGDGTACTEPEIKEDEDRAGEPSVTARQSEAGEQARRR